MQFSTLPFPPNGMLLVQQYLFLLFCCRCYATVFKNTGHQLRSRMGMTCIGTTCELLGVRESWNKESLVDPGWTGWDFAIAETLGGPLSQGTQKYLLKERKKKLSLGS